jgi:dolichol kinase
MGIAMGSTAVTLTFFHAAALNGGVIELLYTAVLAAVGFSFALASLWGAVLQGSFLWHGKGHVETAVETQNGVNILMKIIQIFSTLSIVILLLGFYGNGEIKRHICTTVLFFSLEMTLLVLYEKGSFNFRDRNKSTPALQCVFTLGEWVSLSSVMSLLITDYFLRYILFHRQMTMFDPFIIVAHAGLVGCIIGSNIPLRSVSNFSIRAFLPSAVVQSNLKGRIRVLTWTECTLQIVVTIFSIIMFVNLPLIRYCAVDRDHLQTTSWCKFETSISSFDQSSFQPKLPIQWLIDFLQKSESGVGVLDWNESSFPRFYWLIYWCTILFVFGPISVIIARQLIQVQSAEKRNRQTVIARKYFHVIAILLFAPPTLYAPQMMSLSYAIAASLLVLVERLRVITTKCGGKEKKISKKRFTVNNFFQAFFDEKDEGNRDGFVFTHIALIIGCAFPLWVSTLCDQSKHGDRYYEEMKSLPFLGIISIGVGDAMGAVIGSSFGKRKWPCSNRTFEGSLAMLLSMYVSLCFINLIDRSGTAAAAGIEYMTILVPITILEASTTQIDNICLPVLASLLSLCPIVA